MRRLKITAHTLVKNEARFVWYSVMSVIEHVDKILLWDTGSTDGTKEILKKISKLEPRKVDLKLLNGVTPDEFTNVRQKMLDETKTDWFIVVDGDEIWWEESIRKVTETIRKKGDHLESIVVPTINLVGDIYHYQEEKAGQYRLAGRRGHLSLRLVNRNIYGLASAKPHGTWGWVDDKGKMIQDRDKKKILYVDAPFLHATFLKRAGKREEDLKVPKRAKKLKHEIGISFPKDFYYPEVFFRQRPNMVPDPWETMDLSFKLRAAIETPLRKLKRRILPAKVGY
jgi:glycosyltransferase involved in cell wall biosynthesis